MTTALDEKFGTVLGRRSKAKRKDKDKKAAEQLAAEEARLAELEEAAEEEQRGLLRGLLADRQSLFGTLSAGQDREIGGTPLPRPANPRPGVPRDSLPRNRPGRPRVNLL